MIKIIDVNYEEFFNSKNAQNRVVNTEFIGFAEDYLVIHCLIKEWNPSVIFEIGTSVGNGSVVIKNASPTSKIYTLDIRNCGENCPPDVVKLVGNSLSWDYSKHYPIDCWFIDGHHVYENVFHETREAIASEAKYILYHDADIPEVFKGITDSIEKYGDGKYILYRVVAPPFVYSSSGQNITRVAYAIKK